MNINPHSQHLFSDILSSNFIAKTYTDNEYKYVL